MNGICLWYKTMHTPTLEHIIRKARQRCFEALMSSYTLALKYVWIVWSLEEFLTYYEYWMSIVHWKYFSHTRVLVALLQSSQLSCFTHHVGCCSVAWVHLTSHGHKSRLRSHPASSEHLTIMAPLSPTCEQQNHPLWTSCGTYICWSLCYEAPYKCIFYT